MARNAQHASLPVGAANDRRCAIHALLGIDAARHARLGLERPPRLHVRFGDGVRAGIQERAAVVAHLELARLQPQRCRPLLVQVERGIQERVLRARLVPWNHVCALVRTARPVQQEIAPATGTDIAAARRDKLLHLADAVRPKRRELQLAVAARHHEEVESVQPAGADDLTIQKLQLHLR